MIVDKIQNWPIYFKQPIFKNIFEELKKYNIETPNGIYKKQQDYYFKVMSYNTKTNPEIIESHKKEVDVQIILSGAESIKIYNHKNVEITKAYKEKTDCQFYKRIKDNLYQVNLIPGYMAIFFPDDIHQAQFALNKITTLKKIVIKINEKLFT